MGWTAHHALTGLTAVASATALWAGTTVEWKGGGGDWEKCGSTPGDALVACVWSAMPRPTDEFGAFEVTKRVAWLLHGGGGGLLIKNAGENVVNWKGYNFSASRICYPDGHIYKVISDAGPGGANGASWQDNGFVDRGLYVPAIDPR